MKVELYIDNGINGSLKFSSDINCNSHIEFMEEFQNLCNKYKEKTICNEEDKTIKEMKELFSDGFFDDLM